MTSKLYVKGHVPWNVGKRGYMGANETSFKKGNTPPQQNPKGYRHRYHRLRVNGSEEVIHTINIDWRGNRKVHNSYKWYVWEVANQRDRPRGVVLAIIDGDPDNVQLENLELITRAELLRRNHE